MVRLGSSLHLRRLGIPPGRDHPRRWSDPSGWPSVRTRIRSTVALALLVFLALAGPASATVIGRDSLSGGGCAWMDEDGGFPVDVTSTFRGVCAHARRRRRSGDGLRRPRGVVVPRDPRPRKRPGARSSSPVTVCPRTREPSRSKARLPAHVRPRGSAARDRRRTRRGTAARSRQRGRHRPRRPRRSGKSPRTGPSGCSSGPGTAPPSARPIDAAEPRPTVDAGPSRVSPASPFRIRGYRRASVRGERRSWMRSRTPRRRRSTTRPSRRAASSAWRRRSSSSGAPIGQASALWPVVSASSVLVSARGRLSVIPDRRSLIMSPLPGRRLYGGSIHLGPTERNPMPDRGGVVGRTPSRPARRGCDRRGEVRSRPGRDPRVGCDLRGGGRRPPAAVSS
jgi:hypothetical protein